MKIKDLKRVNHLIDIKEKCQEAYAGLDVYLERALNEKADAGKFKEDFNSGYWASFFMHHDGSGPGANLNGCYVGVQAAEALKSVLDEQVSRCNAELRKLGVEL